LLAHACDVWSPLSEAYFAGSMGPFRLQRSDEELLLALGGKGMSTEETTAEMGLPTNSAVALGAQRIAREIARNSGLCIGKEVLVLCRPAQASQTQDGTQRDPWPFTAWLPPLHQLQRLRGHALELLQPSVDSKLELRGSDSTAAGYPSDRRTTTFRFGALGISS